MAAFFPERIVARVARSRKLDGIVFWTKDIRNLVRHPELARVVVSVPAVVQFTATGLAGGPWEPGAPPLDLLLPELRELAARLPRGAIRWRFDPIVAAPGLGERFCRIKEALDSALGGLADVTVSFPDPYKKAVARAGAAGLAWPVMTGAEKAAFVAFMAGEFGLRDEPPVKLCCEPDLLALPGVGQAHCVDGALFDRLYGLRLAELPKDAGQRRACGCSASTDIGAYDMVCGHGCRYCYANPEP